MSTETTRRDTLRYLGMATVSGGAAIPAFGGVVSATESGESELTLNGEIPTDTRIDATIEEYDTEGSESPITTQTVEIEDVNTPIQFGDLDGQPDYYYDFHLELLGNNDSPELESLSFEVPKGPEDYTQIDFTNVLEWQEKPDHVTIEYDEYYLRQYQPLLRMGKEPRDSHKGLYGYVAKSDEHETDALCYWSQLTHQNGLPVVSKDSHLGDHEPIYVFVNSMTGVVEEIHYSAYHWFTGSASNFDEDTLETVRADYPTHAVFTVVTQWHNYRYTPSRDGAFVELKPWPEVRQTWMQNGFYDPAEVSAIENPWTIRDRDSWWAVGSLDGTLAGIWATIGDLLGWYGSDEADYEG